MNREELLNIFNLSINGKKHIEAMQVIDNDLISKTEIEASEEYIAIEAQVISDNLMSTYISKIAFDMTDKNFKSTYCTCGDYEKFELVKKNYCCKHIMAMVYSTIDDMLSIINNKKSKITEDTSKESLLNQIIGFDKNELLKFEIYLEKETWSSNIKVYFKIGANNKLYVIRDISQFLIHYYNNIPLRVGTEGIIFKPNQKIYFKDASVMNFINMIFKLEEESGNFKKFINGKYIIIPEYLIKTFFEFIKDSKIYLSKGFFLKEVEGFIIYDNPPLRFSLSGTEKGYTLFLKNEELKRLSSENDIFQISNYLYLPDKEFSQNIESIITLIEEGHSIDFKNSDEKKIFNYLIPKIKSLSNNVSLNKYIEERIIDVDPQFKFYLDSRKNILILKVVVKYENLEFNILEDVESKFIYRRYNLENKIISLVSRLGFSKKSNNIFDFNDDEDKKFMFLKQDILNLQKEGEVFYSDKIKNVKNINSSNIKIHITKGKYNYFDFKYNIEGIDNNELNHILKSFSNNLKYHKLKTGEFIDLDSLELKKLANLINVVSNGKLNKETDFTISNSKMLYLNEFFATNSIGKIEGIDCIKDVKAKLDNLYKNDYIKPVSFNGKLREYQKHGVKWFEYIKNVSAGGILADEMGLGKTIQTLAFLSKEYDSNNYTKTLIVTPTSLIYNWQSEIQKFTKLKVGIASGSKVNRLAIIKEFNDNNSNIILTTYGTLKNDINEYSQLKFDFLILDEAQNIKNSSSISAKSVKKINSAYKFALTGTPIENSLNELWSIFDFVMPGYLKKESNFNSRYNKNLKEEKEVFEELNKLTNPFILRRFKKDVIEELPDKIIKNIIVPLDGENKKVYGLYSKSIQNLLEKGETLDSNSINKDRLEILAHITKLRQLCLDPLSVVDNYKGNSTKIDVLLDIISGKIEERHKILVFSQFTSVLKNISFKLNQLNLKHSYLDGSLNIKQREIQINTLKNGENNIFLISTKAGGTGLNLTEADIVIHFDPWWNPAVEDQATDRAHRIGQKNAVEVIRLIAKDTIEEKIVDLQDRKRELVSNILDFSSLGKNISITEMLEILKHR